MILYNKSEEELNQLAEDLLRETNISNQDDGSRAKTILKIVNKVLATYYEALDFNITMAFVSKATGVFLDEIGVLLNCIRLPGEDDDNYRYRISNQVYVVEGANKTAIRLAALSVKNVVGVILTPYVFGTGSFTVHVITDTLSNLPSALVQVQEQLDNVEAFGVKGIAVAPKAVPVFLSMVLTFYGTVVDNEIKTMVANNIRSEIVSFLNKVSMGSELVISDINYLVRQSGKGYVQDVAITRFEVNKRPALITNYKPYWDEKLYAESINDIVVV